MKTPMKVALGVVGVVIVFILGVAAIGATKPDESVVSRSVQINAPPEKVFPLVNDFRHWPQWSPWEKLDPDLQRTYSGSASGEGSHYAWHGNDDVGSGEMTITESTPHSRVLIALHFITPFEATNVTDFSFTPRGPQTQVVWTMRGPASFMMKMMSVIFDFDAMIGKDFDAGLAAMKAAAERT
jgi:uncharacterized protein YndB with AHSA1/START domain